MKFKDKRTSWICKWLHPRFEQILRIVGNVRYPNICYRCEPDYFMEEIERMQRSVNNET